MDLTTTSLDLSAIDDDGSRPLHFCEICSYNTADKNIFNRHLRRDATNKNELNITSTTGDKSKLSTICEDCGKTFKSKFGLSLHQKNIHLKVFKHICHVCGKGFNQTQQFRIHCIRHQGIPSGKCEFCKQTFTGHCSLTRHLVICSSNPKATNEAKHICEECQASYKTKDALRYHVKRKHEVTHCVVWCKPWTSI